MLTNDSNWVRYINIFSKTNMKVYLDLLKFILENGHEKEIELILAPYPLLDINWSLI